MHLVQNIYNLIKWGLNNIFEGSIFCSEHAILSATASYHNKQLINRFFHHWEIWTNFYVIENYLTQKTDIFLQGVSKKFNFGCLKMTAFFNAIIFFHKFILDFNLSIALGPLSTKTYLEIFIN
ncbi:hypothetical protein BpHYR1_018122 [Brachionus plicatilis]|uniref:Uncharacterized protein n=1 Tax=Brachionus plicatilis TaxID=10195 RepID=A0A3M7PF58_BRAPC|nr:hypothetical protein BpHYR1_018122 [Brachionus plicatilis]